MKKGIVTGAFDLLHAGHIHLFKEAKKHCDYLIVALHVDPSVERDTKSKPIESILERGIKLRACKYVNTIIPYEKESDLPIIFKHFNVDIRFLGSDYKDPNKHISYPDMIPTKFIDSLLVHTSEIIERIQES